MKRSKKEGGDQDESLKGHVGSAINSSAAGEVPTLPLRESFYTVASRESTVRQANARARVNEKEKYICTEVFESSVNAMENVCGRILCYGRSELGFFPAAKIRLDTGSPLFFSPRARNSRDVEHVSLRQPSLKSKCFVKGEYIWRNSRNEM